MTTPATDPVARRFAIIQIVRLFGVGVALFGVAIVARRLVEPAELIGGLLIVIGAVDALLMPKYLASQWRTPPAPPPAP